MWYFGASPGFGAFGSIGIADFLSKEELDEVVGELKDGMGEVDDALLATHALEDVLFGHIVDLDGPPIVGQDFPLSRTHRLDVAGFGACPSTHVGLEVVVPLVVRVAFMHWQVRAPIVRGEAFPGVVKVELALERSSAGLVVFYPVHQH